MLSVDEHSFYTLIEQIYTCFFQKIPVCYILRSFRLNCCKFDVIHEILIFTICWNNSANWLAINIITHYYKDWQTTTCWFKKKHLHISHLGLFLWNFAAVNICHFTVFVGKQFISLSANHLLNRYWCSHLIFLINSMSSNWL
mgnify:CR=1 FL=1